MLIEQVVRRDNLLAAYERVRANKGAPGVDGMTTDQLAEFCREHWPRIREQLLGGKYVPQPVRKVEIPKPDGNGVRMLGIPTVLDRLIQQALLRCECWVYSACWRNIVVWRAPDEPPDAERHVRWCGEPGGATRPATRLISLQNRTFTSWAERPRCDHPRRS
ncbi:MAG TPA: hypothetical protein VN541_16790 [Tepidisphaeraceae bacterium]|nr:hypothetical protein [Tepidisphaeraceae bacterium]